MHRSSIAAALGPLVVAAAAALPPVAQAKIVVGQGIAGVKLGMTMAQAEKKLGQPTTKQPPDFNGNVEWNYAKTPLMGALGFNKGGQLIGLWTSTKAQKTSKGIGPGASLAKVRKAYPQAKCKTGPFGLKSLVCVITTRDHRHGQTVETSFGFFTRSAPMREVNIDVAA